MASTDSITQNGHTEAAGASLTPAQKLQQKHHAEPHNPTIEDVPDEADLKHTQEPLSSSILEAPGDEPTPGWVKPVSTKAAGKRKEDVPTKENQPVLDISEESFPTLGGAPKPKQPAIINSNWKNSNKTGPTISNGTNGISSNGASTPTSGLNTPPSSTGRTAFDPRKINIPGQVREDYFLAKDFMLPRQALKKPLPEILKDINKKSRNVTVTHSVGANGATFSASGPSREACQQALKDVLSQVGAKVTQKIPIPQSARAHIIGKQGSKIKELQERTGARIQIPKLEDIPHPVDEDDDDPMIDIIAEGNAHSVAAAKNEILRIAGERTVTVNTRLRTIPAELYPFIEEKQNDSTGVNIRVPRYHVWKSQQPPEIPAKGQLPDFLPAADENHITLAGDRSAVQAKKAEIERLAEELQRELTIDQLSISRDRHQHIIGQRGMSPEDFFKETGCAIILPSDADDDTITIIGRPNQTKSAKEKAFKLASTMMSDNLNASKEFRNIQDPGAHVSNVAQYLRQRNVFEDLENHHQSHIITPERGSSTQWQLFAREMENIANARNDIISILQAHPPSRMTTVQVDPFFHQHLRNDITPRVKKDFGVHVVTPGFSDADAPVLLVFEGEDGLAPNYQVPRGRPSPGQIQAFQQGLQDAQKHILNIIAAQAEIISTSIDVPQIFHERLRRYITAEQKTRSVDQIPVRVSAAGTVVTLRGPAPAVQTLASKVNAFVEQAKQDEKERDFTMSFDFPQNHANQLIGKQGSNIKELRDKFDVEIKVDNGKVELKGPKAKAELAKSHITSLGRQWADEVVYNLKIDPKYHRELIGRQGDIINRLQTKYKVQVHFPRAARSIKDDQSNADAASEAGRRGGRRDQAPDEVIVKGPKKGADEARGEILDLLQYLTDNSYTATISVQQSQIPSLIGQRGKAMDDLRADTKTRIDIPGAKDSKDPSDLVEIQIKGTKSGVLQAKKLLEEKKSVFDQTISKTLEVDKKHHSALIGAHGANIRNIVLEAGGSDDRREIARAVQFPKAESDGNMVKIEGKKDVVEKIIAAILKTVAERDNQVTETIDIPTSRHRLLIGRGGEIKKDLESKLNVLIDIPRQGNGQSGVKITGLPADVEKAKEHILDLVKEQEGETIMVPKKIHYIVADNGQFFRRLKNDHQVSVDHSGHKLPPKPAAPTNTRVNGGSLPLITDDAEADVHSWNVINSEGTDIEGEIPWVLRGPPENVVKAKSALSSAIEQALKSTTTGYLVLPDPRTYKYVIGQGGSKVNSIRKATGCKITVPRDQAKDEAIEISGSAEGVEKAKDLVLQAVKEGGNAANGSRF